MIADTDVRPVLSQTRVGAAAPSPRSGEGWGEAGVGMLASPLAGKLHLRMNCHRAQVKHIKKRDSSIEPSRPT